ncbi:hypothetical protein [Ralstonia phage RP31]|uniref:Uncharacterized protein n=1 Tax=Ralstonia phage RP31 TaxID=1923890 RepID=A0A1L7N1G0_9CAUD|nr:hypothetical protein [Ralstonia phage RP31]
MLPAHTKRLVLWSTLYSKMCGAQRFTKEQCDRLNGAFALCKDNSALDLPAKLGKFISNDLDECTAVAKTAIRGEQKEDEAAAEFVRNIPSWLRYASDAFMLKDFKTLLAIHHPAVA